MELTAAEERKIIEGLKTFAEFFARTLFEHSSKTALAEPAHPRANAKAIAKEASFTPAPIRPAVPHLIPVMKWNEHHAYPSVGSLRWLIFNAENTGVDSVIRRVGRRVLIDEAAFFEWVGSDRTPLRP